MSFDVSNYKTRIRVKCCAVCRVFVPPPLSLLSLFKDDVSCGADSKYLFFKKNDLTN